MSVYRENPLYLSLEDPLYHHGGSAVPLYSIPHRTAPPLYSVPQRDRTRREPCPLYPPLYSSLHRPDVGGEAEDTATAEGGLAGPSEPTSQGRQRRRVRYTRTRVTMSVRHRPHGSGGDRGGDGEDGDGQPSPPRRLQSRWNPTLVRWSQTVRSGAPGRRRSPSPTGRRTAAGGSGSGSGRDGDRGYGSSCGPGAYSSGGGGSVRGGGGGCGSGGGGCGRGRTGGGGDVAGEGRGRARTVSSRVPLRSASLRSNPASASASLSPPRLVSAGSSPDRVSPFRRGSGLRRSDSLKSDREPGYRQQIDCLRRRLLTSAGGLPATDSPRRPRELLLTSRRPVTSSVFTVQDRAAEAAAVAGWTALLDRAEEEQGRAWRGGVDITDGGVKIEEIVGDGGGKCVPRSIQETHVMSRDERSTHRETHTHAAQRTEEHASTTKTVRTHSHEEISEKKTVTTEKTHDKNGSLLMECGNLITTESMEGSDRDDVMASPDLEVTTPDPGVTSPVEDVTSPTEGVSSCGGETRRSLVQLCSAGESGDSDRTLSVEVSYAPAARELLRLDGRVRDKVEAIEVAELERELEQEFEQEYAQELQQELEQELQERLEQELGQVSGQYDDAAVEDSEGSLGENGDNRGGHSGDTVDQGQEYKYHEQDKSQQVETEHDIRQEGHEEHAEDMSRADWNKSKASDASEKRQRSPSASQHSEERHKSLPTYTTHAESRQPPEPACQSPVSSSPGRRRSRRPGQQPTSRPSDTPPRTPRSRRHARSDSEDEEALRRRERGWNAPQQRSRSVPRVRVTAGQGSSRAAGSRTPTRQSRERAASVKTRSVSSPPTSGKSPSGRAAESPRTAESSKTSSVCSSSVSSPSKSASRGWSNPAGRSGRISASSATRAGVARDGGSRERMFSPPSSLARPSRHPSSTLRPALSSPSLVASSTAGHARPSQSAFTGQTRMSTSLQHGREHGQHVCSHASQHGLDCGRRHGAGGVVRASSFCSRPAPPRGRSLTRAASTRTPGTSAALRTGRGDRLRGAHATSHANTETAGVRRQLSPYRSATLPRTVCRQTTTTATTAAAAAGSPRREASDWSPRKVLSTSTETGYDSMEVSPPPKPTHDGGRRGGFGEGSLPLEKTNGVGNCRGGFREGFEGESAADEKWFRTAAYVPMLKSRLTATEAALRASSTPPQGVTACLREKFENLELLVSTMEDREQQERRDRAGQREMSPVRDAIDHFERLRSALSSPDLTMKSPPLVRGLSVSLSRDLHHAGQPKEEAAPPQPRRCRPLSLSLESVRSRHLSPETLRSQREVSPSPHLDPAQYRQYVLRLLRASRSSPHFRRLRRHYHSLERLMALERLTETCSTPGRREFPSYETWRRIRAKERALAEMKAICEQLDAAQKRREFYSRVSARYGERWAGDRSLDRRQRSVEDLTRRFDAIVVREQQEAAGTERAVVRPELGGRVRRSLSSLSPRQMEGLRDRLNGIYGSQTSLKSESARSQAGSVRSQSEPRRFVDVTAGTAVSSSATALLHVRPASEPEPQSRVCTAGATTAPARADSVHQMRTDPPVRAESVHQTRIDQAPDAAERRRMSLALCREVAERFAPRGRDRLAPPRSKSASPAASAVSPRTCYSVDLSEDGERRADAHEFMLVLTPERSQSESRSTLSRGERQQLVERSERLREKRLARLRRPLSAQAETDARSSMSRSSSAQTVVEREMETGDVPRAVYRWEREAATTAAAEAGAGTNHRDGAPQSSRDDPTRFNSLPCPLRRGGSGSRRRFLSPEYLPERSASSTELGRRGRLGETDALQYADDFHRAFDDFARSRSASPVARGWSYSPPRHRRASCSPPPRRYGPPVRLPSASPPPPRHTSSPPRYTSPPPPRRGYGDPAAGEVRRIRRLLQAGRCEHGRPVPAPRLSKAASLPQLGAAPAGAVHSLAQRYEATQERQAAEEAAVSAAAAAGVRGSRARSWSPPRNLRQLGAYISRTRILGKIVELQRRLRRPTAESEELEDLRSFVERERETLMRVRRGQVDRLKQQLQDKQEDAGGAPRRSTSSPSLGQSPGRMQSYGHSQRQSWSQSSSQVQSRGRGRVGRSRDVVAGMPSRFGQDLRRGDGTADRGRPVAGSRSPIGRPGVSVSPIGRQGSAMSPIGRPRQFRPISGGGGRSQSEEVSFSERPLITSTPLPCVPARPAPSPGTQTFPRPAPNSGSAHTLPSTNQRCRWAGEPRDWSIHRPVGRYVPPTRSTGVTCRRPAQFGFQPYAGSRRWHCDACAVRAYNRWRTRKRNVTWKEPVIGPIAKSMSTSAIPDRRVIAPQRGRRDERDAAGGEQWRGTAAPLSADQLLEEERQRRHLLERHDLERRRHGDCFTPAQKSPIPLNRYDNLFDDVTIRSSRGGDAKMAARALHGFKPAHSRELSFNKGDIIFIRRQVDRNWLEGEINGRIGIFPVNYVQVVPIDSQRGGQPKLGGEGQARARYSFTAQTPVELSLRKGDLVTLLRRVDGNWYEGRLGNRTGIFPTSYVEVLGRPLPQRIETSAKPSGLGLTGGAASAPSGGLQNQLHVDTSQQDAVPYKALYNYDPQNEDELALADGDVVFVIEKCEDGWYVGTNDRSGMFGTFPGNYVQQV